MIYLNLSVILGLASLFITGCAPTGGESTRSLGHTYQDSRGITIIALFDMGTEARGMSQTIGNGGSPRSMTVSQAEFDALWGGLDEAKLSPFAIKSKSKQFNAKVNYVIIKGVMPDGATTYVVPKTKAPASVKSWIEAFRRKTHS